MLHHDTGSALFWYEVYEGAEQVCEKLPGKRQLARVILSYADVVEKECGLTQLFLLYIHASLIDVG